MIRGLSGLPVALFTLLLVACGGGGGDGGASAPPAPSVSLHMDADPVRPYQAVIAKVAGRDLALESYTGSIGGVPLTAVRHDASTLILVIPELPAGSHDARVTIDGEEARATVSVVVDPGSGVADPDSYLDERIALAGDALLALRDELASQSGNGATIARIQEAYDNLQAAAAGKDALGEQDKRWLANFLLANELQDEPLAKRALPYDWNACQVKLGAFVGAMIANRLMVAATAVAIYSGVTGIGAIAAGIAVAELISTTHASIDLMEAALDQCLDRDQFTIQGDDAVPRAKALVSGKSLDVSPASATLSFVDRTGTGFRIVSTYSMEEATLTSAIAEFRTLLSPFFFLLPDSWVVRIANAQTTGLQEIDDPSHYAIANLSDPEVQGGISTAGDRAILTFSYKVAKLTDTSFSFDLVDSRDGTVRTFAAVLAGLNIGIDPGSKVLPQGEFHLLEVFVERGDGAREPIAVEELAFQSGNPQVATVNSEGLVAAVSEGEAAISITHAASGRVLAFGVEVSSKCKSATYQIGIRTYNPSYELTTEVATVNAGDTLTVYNGSTQIIGLKRDGIDVAIYNAWDGPRKYWSYAMPSVSFGPVDVNLPGFEYSVTDITNGCSVRIPVNLTVSNELYRRIAGATLSVSNSFVTSISFNADLTYSYTTKGSPGSGQYSFLGSHRSPAQQCDGGLLIDKNLVGYVGGTYTSDSNFPNYIAVYEDGTYSENSFYMCPEHNPVGLN